MGLISSIGSSIRIQICLASSDNFPTFFDVTKIFDYSDTRFSNLAIEYRCENEKNAKSFSPVIRGLGKV